MLVVMYNVSPLYYLGGDGVVGCNLGCGDGSLRIGGGLPLKRLGLGCTGTHGCYPPAAVAVAVVAAGLFPSGGGEEVLNVEVIWS